MTAGRAPYDHGAARYDATRGGVERGRRQAARLEPFLDRGQPVLEIGVGTGLVAAALDERGFDVFGFDLSREMLQQASLRIPRRIALASQVQPTIDALRVLPEPQRPLARPQPADQLLVFERDG